MRPDLVATGDDEIISAALYPQAAVHHYSHIAGVKPAVLEGQRGVTVSARHARAMQEDATGDELHSNTVECDAVIDHATTSFGEPIGADGIAWQHS